MSRKESYFVYGYTSLITRALPRKTFFFFEDMDKFSFFHWPSVIILFFFLDKFVLKTWISRRVLYFVGILSRVDDRYIYIYIYGIITVNHL